MFLRRLRRTPDLLPGLCVCAVGMWAMVLCSDAVAARPSGSAEGRADLSLSFPDTGEQILVWQEADDHQSNSTRYQITSDTNGVSRARRVDLNIRVRHGIFDPLNGVPQVDHQLSAGDENQLFIVQFVTPPIEAYRASLREHDVAIVKFMPAQSYIVHGDADAVLALDQESFVRWVGPYEPAYRLERYLIQNLDRAQDLFPSHRYNIQLTASSAVTKNRVSNQIEALGGIIHSRDHGKFLISATLTPEQLVDVAHLNNVMFIDRWSPQEPDMDIVREFGGANFIETVAGYTGVGVRGEIWDGGFNVGHVDFDSNPLILHTPVPLASHGASCSGIVFGDGSVDKDARGLAPDGQGIVASSGDVGGSRYAHTAELLEPPYEATFQTSSVGSFLTESYTSTSADMDAILFDFEVVHCQSQSNSGTQASRPEAWAKNTISVGGIRHQNTLELSDDCWCGFASIGPAEDGRIKPDLSFFNDAILTVGGGSPTDYTSFGGTSGATPIVAGHIGLFHQMWADGIFGNPVFPDSTVFESRPHLSTSKAVMINTARQYQFSGEGEDLGREHQGWGTPNVGQLYALRDKMFVVNESHVLQHLQSAAYTLTVDAGETAMRATMVYTDPPGTTSSSQHRINDLSLRVTSPSGDVYWGNNGLDVGNWSVTDGDSNTIDTTENVFVESPEEGEWLFEVFADEVNEDGHIETLEMDADFALVVTGVQPIPIPLVIHLPEGSPALVAPGESSSFAVQVLDVAEAVIPATATLHLRTSAEQPFEDIAMTHSDGIDYVATLPGLFCADEPEFYMSFEGDGGSVVVFPQGAPDDNLLTAEVGTLNIVFNDTFEGDLAWSVAGDASDGHWDKGIPVGGGDRGDPPFDADGSGQCYLTDNEDDNSDVDDGETVLTSPTTDGSAPNAMVSYFRWYSNTFGDAPEADVFVVEVSNNDGADWAEVETVGPSGTQVNGLWYHRSFTIADLIEPTSTMRFRFHASDLGDGSVVEAGVDQFRISFINCEDTLSGADLDGDDVVGPSDLAMLLGSWGSCESCPADLNLDGVVGPGDLAILLGSWGPVPNP